MEQIVPGKATLIFGARRVGKTVLMRTLIGQYPGRTMMLNGEDYDTLALLGNQSVANYRHLLAGTDLLAIDEAQNVPHIGRILKLIVDEVPGVSVLASGSSSFDLLQQAGEPLVGRATQFLLTPFSPAGNRPDGNPARHTPQPGVAPYLRLSYPEVVMLDNFERKVDYLRDIVGAYLLKDILAIDGLKSSAKMRDLLRLIAFQMGSEVSYDELGKQLGMSKSTVEKYLDLLEKVFVIYRLGSLFPQPPQRSHQGWQMVLLRQRHPKRHHRGILPLGRAAGCGRVVGELPSANGAKAAFNQRQHKEFYFWRTYDKQE